ncbi:MAG: HNH endonuclease [Aphanothece saxicola GSE-SYN-MK-01-06B]|jgi:hypothetical protein|nr:HNH endonuclease [Aphanothece saxicola GSE-SYN-MK-01-06B]
MTKSFFNRDQGNAHELLQAWRAANRDGFVLNCTSATKGMIHRATCPHFGDETLVKDETSDLGRKQKICSRNMTSLYEWAKSHGCQTVVACGDCQPVSEDAQSLVMAEASSLDDSGYFELNGITDTRRRVAREIACRQGQPAFRKKLLKAYGGRCAITGCDLSQVLDAAHIVPFIGRETNHVQNGLLLRTDIHTLFDLGLIAIDTTYMQVILHESLGGSEYKSLSGVSLRQPATELQSPSKAALDRHRVLAGLASPFTKAAT